MAGLQHLKAELVEKLVADGAVEEDSQEEVIEEGEAEEEVEASEVDADPDADEGEEVSVAEEGEAADVADPEEDELVEMGFEDFIWQGETFKIPKGTRDKAQKFFNTHYTQKTQKLSAEHKSRMEEAEQRLAKAQQLEEAARQRQAHVQATLDANPELNGLFKRAEAQNSSVSELEEMRAWREEIERERRFSQVQAETDRELAELRGMFKLPDEEHYSGDDIQDKALALALSQGCELREAYLKSYDYFANKDAEKRAKSSAKSKSVLTSKVKAKKEHNPLRKKKAVVTPKKKAAPVKRVGKLNRVRELLSKM